MRWTIFRDNTSNGTTCNLRHARDNMRGISNETTCDRRHACGGQYARKTQAMGLLRNLRYARDDMRGTSNYLEIYDMRGTKYEGQAMKRHAIDIMRGTACEGSMRGTASEGLHARDGMWGSTCEGRHTKDGVRGTTNVYAAERERSKTSLFYKNKMWF